MEKFSSIVIQMKRGVFSLFEECIFSGKLQLLTKFSQVYFLCDYNIHLFLHNLPEKQHVLMPFSLLGVQSSMRIRKKRLKASLLL